MRATALLPAVLSLTTLLVAAEARADEPEIPADTASAAGAAGEAGPSWRDRRLYVGASAGVTFATVEHPEITPSAKFTAASLGLHAGYQLTESFSLGLELNSFEKYVRRASAGELFAPASARSPMVACDSCTDPPSGGYVAGITAGFITVGPRVELTPFGRDGVYVGGFGGVAVVHGVSGLTGFGGAARAGFRLRALEVLTFAVEGGLLGQAFDGGSTFAPYAALMLRPYF